MIWLSLGTFLGVIIIIFLFLNINWIQVEVFTDRVNLNNEERIVLLSDLHSKEFGKNNFRLIKKISKQKPTRILMVGDMIDSEKDNMKISLNLVEKLLTFAPVYFSPGNHERRMPRDFYNRYLDDLTNIGAKVLKDKVIKHNGLKIVGVESKINKYEQRRILESLAGFEFSIILNHEPELFKNVSFNGIMFSGHAHGGQVRIFGKGLYAFGQGYFPKYTSGKYIDKNKTMYVSRGLGGKECPIRIFNRPHIVVVKLK